MFCWKFVVLILISIMRESECLIKMKVFLFLSSVWVDFNACWLNSFTACFCHMKLDFKSCTQYKLAWMKTNEFYIKFKFCLKIKLSDVLKKAFDYFWRMLWNLKPLFLFETFLSWVATDNRSLTTERYVERITKIHFHPSSYSNSRFRSMWIKNRT